MYIYIHIESVGAGRQHQQGQVVHLPGQGLWSRVWGLGLEVLGLEFELYALGIRRFGIRVSGIGWRVEGVASKVGLGFKAAADPVYGRAKCSPLLGSLKTQRT